VRELGEHLGEYDEALRLHEQTLATRMRVLGADHPHTIESLQKVAQVTRRRGHDSP
jgi:hypothetical protein